MRTTTNQGWPVAQGTDPAKQYPTAVDSPFKDDLDTKFTALQAGAPYGVISYSPGPASDGFRFTATTGVTVARGITHDGAGRLTLPTTGIYLVTAYLANSTASIAYMKITAKDDAATKGATGSVGAGTAAGSSSELVQPLVISTAPISIGLWVQCAASIQTSLGYLFIVRLGSL